MKIIKIVKMVKIVHLQIVKINIIKMKIVKITFARAFLAASASAAMARISCSGTRTSFTWRRTQKLRCTEDQLLKCYNKMAICHNLHFLYLDSLNLDSPGSSALHQGVLDKYKRYCSWCGIFLPASPSQWSPSVRGCLQGWVFRARSSEWWRPTACRTRLSTSR